MTTVTCVVGGSSRSRAVLGELGSHPGPLSLVMVSLISFSGPYMPYYYSQSL